MSRGGVTGEDSRLGDDRVRRRQLAPADLAFAHARLPALWPKARRPSSDQRTVARRRGDAPVLGPAADDGGALAQRWVAAVFAIHPLRVESVAWVAERKDVLSGCCFMLTLWCYARYAERPASWGRYLLLVVSFALGLTAKPMLVTLPFVLLLLDYWPLARFGRPPRLSLALRARVSSGEDPARPQRAGRPFVRWSSRKFPCSPWRRLPA